MSDTELVELKKYIDGKFEEVTGNQTEIAERLEAIETRLADMDIPWGSYRD